MASAQLIGCDGGRVAVWIEYDGTTREVTGIRGFNRGSRSVTVVIDSDALDRETVLTIPAGTSIEQTIPVAAGKRWNLTAPADARGFILGVQARARYPGEGG